MNKPKRLNDFAKFCINLVNELNQDERKKRKFDLRHCNTTKTAYQVIVSPGTTLRNHIRTFAPSETPSTDPEPGDCMDLKTSQRPKFGQLLVKAKESRRRLDISLYCRKSGYYTGNCAEKRGQFTCRPKRLAETENPIDLDSGNKADQE